jgi:Asp-tRNA(Asn)/Glu-tRNA(Gln) amidotransferase A subunit family amidase
MNSLTSLSACELAKAIRERRASTVEVLDAHLARRVLGPAARRAGLIAEAADAYRFPPGFSD